MKGKLMSIKSMTGYGSITVDGYMVEIRSLNGRYLDISFRIPQELYLYENDFKKVIRDHFIRGSIELTISRKNMENPVCVPRLNRPYVKYYIDILKEIADLGGGMADYSSLLQIKDIVYIDVDESGIKSVFNNIMNAIENVCNIVSDMRKREGNSLLVVIRENINTLKNICEKLYGYTRTEKDIIRENLKKKIDEFSSDMIKDKNRFEEEVLYFLNRMDFSEEIDRLSSHTEHFLSLLDSEESVGRRLDFLCQEILREFNTIGSKSSLIDVKKLVISGKDIIEKLREQVQNIE